MPRNDEALPRKRSETGDLYVYDDQDLADIADCSRSTVGKAMNKARVFVAPGETTLPVPEEPRYKTVVGTVIDPELEGELRVTVVATGLAPSQPAAEAVPTPRLVARTSNGDVDYNELERPAVARKAAAAGGNNAEADMEYLDIPAFLRRQAD